MAVIQDIKSINFHLKPRLKSERLNIRNITGGVEELNWWFHVQPEINSLLSSISSKLQRRRDGPWKVMRGFRGVPFVIFMNHGGPSTRPYHSVKTLAICPIMRDVLYIWIYINTRYKNDLKRVNDLKMGQLISLLSKEMETNRYTFKILRRLVCKHPTVMQKK